MSSESKKKESDNFDAYWRAKIAPILGSLNMELENLDTLKQVSTVLTALSLSTILMIIESNDKFWFQNTSRDYKMKHFSKRSGNN